MTQLADDLRAVRKLIETPDMFDKYRKDGDFHDFLSNNIDGDQREIIDYLDCFVEGPSNFENLWQTFPWDRSAGHADIIDILDRAIVEAEKEVVL